MTIKEALTVATKYYMRKLMPHVTSVNVDELGEVDTSVPPTEAELDGMMELVIDLLGKEFRKNNAEEAVKSELLQTTYKFMKNNSICCEESIYQSERVMNRSLDFICELFNLLEMLE